MPAFFYHPLRLLNPGFDSPLVDVLTELEHLRRLQISGTTPPALFYQLKSIFHIMESLGSARIEGNNTTLADYVESRMEGRATESDQLREIANIEEAMAYAEEVVSQGTHITAAFIRELHHIAVSGLEREGDRTPGSFRSGPVRISKSEHLPPEHLMVPEYIDELVAFINRTDPPKYDLMKVALAHHRFGWIHPFSNGNGRVVRLLTHALLIKYGFRVQSGGDRILNPTAVFCNDREQYYAKLARADLGTDGGLEEWCIYVLDGILHEINKVNRLTDFAYLRQHILEPALAHARERRLVTPLEHAVLLKAMRAGEVKSADLSDAMPGLSAPQRTYQIRKLVERKMLQPVIEGGRSYSAGFANSFLLRGVLSALATNGFVSQQLAGTPPLPSVRSPARQ
jgi:Fic family protein